MKLCDVEALEASVAVITTLCVPTSPFSGVPDNTPDPVPTSTKLAHAGIVVPVRVIAWLSSSVVITMYA